MSYGIEVYDSNENLIFNEEGGCACYVGEVTSSSSLQGYSSSNIWAVPSMVVSSDTPIYNFNMPSFSCFITNDEIINQRHSGQVSVHWGVF